MSSKSWQVWNAHEGNSSETREAGGKVPDTFVLEQIATGNKCITTDNKKLLVAMHLFLVLKINVL